MNLPYPQLPQTGRISPAFFAVSGKMCCFLKKQPILFLALTGLAAFVSKASAHSPAESAQTGLEQAAAKLAEAAVARLPKPEDPVVLPTDDEVAVYIKNMRESKLRVLQRDPDGWDDLEVAIWKSRDKNYKFDPNDKTKDTDGDGMSDYEEMLVNRDATRKEPVYTKEDQIEIIRESRRQAIAGAIVSPEQQAKARAVLAPWMQEDVPSGIPGKSFSVEEDVAEKTAAPRGICACSEAVGGAKTRSGESCGR